METEEPLPYPTPKPTTRQTKNRQEDYGAMANKTPAKQYAAVSKVLLGWYVVPMGLSGGRDDDRMTTETMILVVDRRRWKRAKE